MMFLLFADTHFINRMQMQQAERIVFPSINGIVVDKDFIGLGHRLEERKHQRRTIDEQSKALESRVMYLERQNKLAERQTQRKKAKLEEIYRIRQRQQQQRQEKDRVSSLREELLQRNRLLSELQRLKHKQHLAEGMTGVYEQRRHDFIEKKQLSKRWESERKFNLENDLQKKQQINQYINDRKYQGKLNIIDYKRDRSKDFINEYQRKMDLESTKRLQKLQAMETLSQREARLIDKLNKSTQAQQQLQSNLKKAQNLQLKALEEIVLQKPKVSAKPKTSHSPVSTPTQDKLDTSSASRQPRSRVDLYKLSADPSQINSVVDRLYLMESMLGIREQLQQSNKSKKKRKYRRKRRSINIE